MGFYGEKEYLNVKFKIVPICKFQKDTFTYYPNTSILNYIEIDTSCIYAFVLLNDTLIGSLSGYQTKTLPTELKTDSMGNYITTSLSDICYGKNFRWQLSENSIILCSKSNSFFYDKKLYDFLAKEKIHSFFIHPSLSGCLFFIRDGRLMIYSNLENKIYEEKELIKGITKIEYKQGEIVIGAVKHSTIEGNDIYYSFEFW
jgi:hypothetical protein